MSDPQPEGDGTVVLEAVDITKQFTIRAGLRSRTRGRSVIQAVDTVSLALQPGAIVAVVGESGSGKTTLGRIMTRLETPTSGTLLLRGKRAAQRGTHALRPFRRDVQMVFQDPFASLNASHTISYHLERPLLIHKIVPNRKAARERAGELLESVHLRPAARFLDQYPTQLSGGQRQRIAIARALAVDPAVVVADEPVSMLDVSIRLSVLNLFVEIARAGRAVMYITHDIASARYFADHVNVMYAGRVVESGPAEQITTRPRHPYTQLLVESAPDPDRTQVRTPLPEHTRQTSAQHVGCSFAARCPAAMPICTEQAPPMFETGEGQRAACWLQSGDRKDTHRDGTGASTGDSLLSHTSE
jgi:peptide/nickel transport system ATP-binding protein